MGLRFDEEADENRLTQELEDWANSRFEHVPPFKTKRQIQGFVNVDREHPPEGDEIDEYPEYYTEAALFLPTPTARGQRLGSALAVAYETNSEPQITTAMYTSIEEELLRKRGWKLKPLVLSDGSIVGRRA